MEPLFSQGNNCEKTTLDEILEKIGTEELNRLQNEQCLNGYEVWHYRFPNPCLHQGFRETKKAKPSYKPGRLYALDCEMVMTKREDGVISKELARVSVVDHNLNVLYDTIVKPEFEIVDYLTAYSGLTKENMKDATKTLAEVQEWFVQNFNSNDIFIGHSIEQDLHVLNLIHLRVIDTAVLYVREFGGSKPKLKFLMAFHLQMLIQCGQKGHNSVEDAQAAMLLGLRNVLPDRYFDLLFSKDGERTSDFFWKHQKFLQVKIFPPDNGMSWLDSVAAYLTEFIRELEAGMTGCSHITLQLCSHFFYMPLKETGGRFGVCFYVGIRTPKHRRLMYRQEYMKFKRRCHSLHLDCDSRILRRSKVPLWAFNPKRVHQKLRSLSEEGAYYPLRKMNSTHSSISTASTLSSVNSSNATETNSTTSEDSSLSLISPTAKTVEPPDPPSELKPRSSLGESGSKDKVKPNEPVQPLTPVVQLNPKKIPTEPLHFSAKLVQPEKESQPSNEEEHEPISNKPIEFSQSLVLDVEKMTLSSPKNHGANNGFNGSRRRRRRNNQRRKRKFGNNRQHHFSNGYHRQNSFPKDPGYSRPPSKASKDNCVLRPSSKDHSLRFKEGCNYRPPLVKKHVFKDRGQPHKNERKKNCSIAKEEKNIKNRKDSEVSTSSASVLASSSSSAQSESLSV